MGFVAPLVLVGLGALAIPVLIHLIQRERKRVVEFPSLMFLRKIPVPVGPAPAHPRLAAAADAARGARAHRAGVRAAVLPPLGAGGGRRRTARAKRSSSSTRRTAWSTAIAGRRRRPPAGAIKALGPGDRASLVLFSSGAEVAVRSAADRGRLESGLASAATGPGATRYAPALKLAGSLLGESALPRREIILITDFQRRGWEQTPGRDDVKLPGADDADAGQRRLR